MAAMIQDVQESAYLMRKAPADLHPKARDPSKENSSELFKFFCINNLELNGN